MNDNFEDIKVGDKVLVRWVWGKSIETVHRVTPKQFKLKSGHVFWKKDGRMVGYYGPRTPITSWPTENDIDSINLNEMRVKLNRIDWYKLPDDQIKAIHAIVTGDE